MQQVEILQAKIESPSSSPGTGTTATIRGGTTSSPVHRRRRVRCEHVYGKVMTGPAELRQFYETAPEAVAHHPTSQFTEVHDDGTAARI